LVVNGITVSDRWSLEHRSRNRNRSIDPVQVVIDMRDSSRVHPVEFQRFYWRWK